MKNQYQENASDYLERIRIISQEGYDDDELIAIVNMCIHKINAENIGGLTFIPIKVLCDIGSYREHEMACLVKQRSREIEALLTPLVLSEIMLSEDEINKFQVYKSDYINTVQHYKAHYVCTTTKDGYRYNVGRRTVPHGNVITEPSFIEVKHKHENVMGKCTCGYDGYIEYDLKQYAVNKGDRYNISKLNNLQPNDEII